MTKENKNDKAVAKATTNEVSTNVSMFDKELVSSQATIDSQDIVISKVALVQKMSKAVDDGAIVGSYIDSVEGNELIEREGSKEYFFFSYQKFIQEFKVEGTESEYLRTVDFNADLPYTEETEEGLIKRDTVIRFYALDVEEIKTGLAFPFIVDFKRTSRNAGKKLATQIQKMQTILGVPSYAKVFELSAKLQENDKGSFYTKEVSAGRNISEQEVEAVEKWVRDISKRQTEGTIKVEENDIETAAVVDAEVVSKPVDKTDKY